MICSDIRRLINYSIRSGLIDREDEIVSDEAGQAAFRRFTAAL